MQNTLMRNILRSSAAALGLVAISSVASAQLLFEPGADPRFNWESYNAFAAEHDLSGQTVSVFGPWTGADEALVSNVLAYFEAATGADVNYTGSDSFEQQIVIDAQAGSAANVAVFPQPGLAADLAADGFLTPLGPEFAAWVTDNYAAGASWVDLGSYAGAGGDEDFYAFAYKVDLKSLVWYSPDNFEDAGYDVPASMEELLALTDQIVADGGVPWCIGLGSGGATGWPATDWVEDLLLRTQPPAVYDGWVTNEIAFNDPRIVGAIEQFGHFARNDAYVDGGSAAVGSVDFRESPQGLFSSPPRCYMHRQASFIPSFFPDGAELGVDADFFYFPAFAGADLGRPVLGAGTLWSITNESDAAHVLMDFLRAPIAHEVWMAQAGFLTPHLGVNLDVYANDTLRGQGAILAEATTFRFDGSDLMPGRIGAGAFWTGMVDYANGASAEDVATQIQNVWSELD